MILVFSGNQVPRTRRYQIVTPRVRNLVFELLASFSKELKYLMIPKTCAYYYPISYPKLFKFMPSGVEMLAKSWFWVFQNQKVKFAKVQSHPRRFKIWFLWFNQVVYCINHVFICNISFQGLKMSIKVPASLLNFEITWKYNRQFYILTNSW